jgi:hypothetical protein
MTALALPVRVLERVVRPAPLGLMLWDAALREPIRSELSITVRPAGRPSPEVALFPNKGGVWIADRLPGRASFDLPDPPLTYRVTVVDPAGAFLPVAFDADLPAGGLCDWPGWDTLDQSPLAPLQPLTERIPLFSSPARQIGAPLAEIRCQLAERASGRAAAWAIVTATHEGDVCGLAMADAEGRATIRFPYPARPRPTLATSPPAVTEFRWSVEIAAFYHPGPGAAPAIPDLAAVFGQLAHPAPLWRSTVGAGAPLPATVLSFGRPLVVRTEDTPDGPSSSLLLGQS